jgi:cellulose biosynthesis protein BcsQ
MIKFLISLLFVGMLLQAEEQEVVENSEINSTKEKKEVLVVDLDKERANSTRGKNNDELIDGSIYLDSDNDEVSFRGDILLKKAPVTVSYGDNDEVALVGNSITIKTMELKNNSHIIMRDKNGKIFVDQVIRR